MSIELLTFSEEDINAIYTELADLSVPLDNDPVSFGPKRLNAKTAEVRKMLDRVHRIYLDLSQRLGASKRTLRRLEASLDLEKKHLFANDPETRAGRNVADREAIATGKLRTQVEELNQIKILVTDLEAVLVVVKAKHADLKDTEGRLKDQVRLCGEELSLGSRWGSAVPEAKPIDHRYATRADVDAIDTLLAEMNNQIDLSQGAGNFPATHMIGKANPVVSETEVRQMPFVVAEDIEAHPEIPVQTEESTELVELDQIQPKSFTLDLTAESDCMVVPPAPESVAQELVTNEDNILEDVLPVDLTSVLPSKTTQAEADAFMDEMGSFNSTQKTKPIKSKVLDELEDLLSSFESVNG